MAGDAAAVASPDRLVAGTGKWTPYSRTWLELPLPFLSRIPKGYYRMRWRMQYPLSYRLFGGLVSVGEVLVFLVLLLITVGGGAATWSSTSGSGQLASFLMIFVWALACHNSVWAFLLGLPFERSLAWHKLFVWATIAEGINHGLVCLRDEVTKHDNGRLLTGWVFWGSIIAMLVLSVAFIRRYLFEPFYRVHIVLSVVVLGAGAAHGSAAQFAGFALWVMDVLIRYLYMAYRKNPRQADFTRLAADVTRISFTKDKFAYQGGQYVFVCVPEISPFQWHPFSLSSHPQSELVSLHVRALGDWTKKLYNHVGKDGAQTRSMQILVEGPYGSPMVDLFGTRYQIFLLISGGIGITPMQSVANELLAEYDEGRPIKKIRFVWSVRDRFLVGALEGHQGDHFHAASASKPEALPASFQPDLVSQSFERHSFSSMERGTAGKNADAVASPVLQAEFHLTKVRTEAEYEDANIRPSAQPFLRFGRPDIPKIFAETHTFAKDSNEARVAVLVCGPSAMVEQVKHLCAKRSTRKVHFDYHGEIFDF